VAWGRYIAPSAQGAGDYRIVPWPALAEDVVPFGTTNGSRNAYPEDVDAWCGGRCVLSGGRFD
jgi:hypothetical protein